MKINCNFKNENNGNCKITDEQVQEIKFLYQQEGYSLRRIAEMFGISHSQVRRIALELSRSN